MDIVTKATFHDLITEDHYHQLPIGPTLPKKPKSPSNVDVGG